MADTECPEDATMSSPDPIARARGLVEAARRIVVFTGAGVSAESGIPTFRDALTGLWARHDPQRLASAEGFAADPAFVWGWYADRRARVRACAPNPAHHAIAALQAARGATVVTQNVDGLHARAGAIQVIELHGNLVRATCLDGCGWSDDADALEAVDVRVPPRCPVCGALARPDVVWFGEMLPAEAWSRAAEACEACDLCLVVGTSGVVHPAAGLPMLARRSGARVVVVGPEPCQLDDLADLVVRAQAGKALPALCPGGGVSRSRVGR